MSTTYLIYMCLHVARVALFFTYFFFVGDLKILVGAMFVSVILLEMDNYQFQVMFRSMFGVNHVSPEMLKAIASNQGETKSPVGFNQK